MSVELTTTLRNYLSIADLQKLANISVLDNDEALRQIARAEEAIDDYVGFQERSVQWEFRGFVSSVSNSTEIIDTNSTSQLHVLDNFFAGCVIEIIGGTGVGQVRYITASSYNQYSVTTVDAFDTEPDTTSFYKIYQLAKFPRQRDVIPRQDGLALFKSLPDPLHKAVAAQIEYMIEQGDDFFQSNDSDITSERIGNYSYTKNGGQVASPNVRLVGPRVRALLIAYKNSGGTLENDNPTSF